MAPRQDIAGAYLRTERLKLRGFDQSDITLIVSPGSRIGIWGEMGSGKTQLLRTLARLDPLEAGSLYWNDRDVSRYSALRIKTRQHHVSLLLDNPYTYFSPKMRTGDLLRQMHGGHQAPIQRLFLEHALPPAILDEPVGNLSGLIRLQLALYHLKVNKSPVVLVDDIFRSLIQEVWPRALRAVTGAVSGTQALLIASRYRPCVQDMDTVLHLEEGQLTRSA
ncbi:MAG: ATP-binding cassette domain-containing protein [Anaerolineae bacterium]|nr:ATP-binding cassette domain-containing protein [Anaerolineae bacterium]